MEPNPFGDPPLAVQLKTCSEGAETFVTQFYREINNGNSLSSFYIDSSTLYAAAKESSDIVINGAKLNSSAEYEALLLEQRGGPIPDTTNGASNRRGGPKPRVRYEVDSIDSQPINYDFQIALPSNLPKQEAAYGGGCISMLVSVMGTLHIGNENENENEPTSKFFTDALVLWPNWDARGRSASARRASGLREGDGRVKNPFIAATSSDTGLGGTDNGSGVGLSAATVLVVAPDSWTTVTRRRPDGRKNGYGSKGKEDALFPLQPRLEFSRASHRQRY